MSRRDDLLKLATFVSKLTIETIDGARTWEKVTGVEISGPGTSGAAGHGYLSRGKEADVRLLTSARSALDLASDDAFVLQFLSRSDAVRSQWPGFPGLADLYAAIDRGAQSPSVSADIAAFAGPGEAAAD